MAGTKQKIVPLLLGLIVLLIVFRNHANKVTLYLPIAQSVKESALSGVEANNEWRPLIRQIKGFNMVLVPSGCFEMGTTQDQLDEALSSCNSFFGPYGCIHDFANEQPSHSVCISRPFWIDETEVTNEQFGFDSSVSSQGSPKDQNWPRESVTWEMAAEFCSDRGGRLPTEAEWEFAARGPDSLLYPFGNEYNIQFVTLRKISPPVVGEHPDGASWVGAQDMSGGIAEWVFDWYEFYSGEPAVDPIGPDNGSLRITKGGSWFSHASFQVRTAIRETYPPEWVSSNIGFRCVLDLETQ